MAGSRRELMGGAASLAFGATLAACSRQSPDNTRPSFGSPSPIAPSPGQRVLTAELTAAPTKIDLGGRQVDTWAFNSRTPVLCCAPLLVT